MIINDFRCLCYPFILVHVRDHAGSCHSNVLSAGIKRGKEGLCSYGDKNSICSYTETVEVTKASVS